MLANVARIVETSHVHAVRVDIGRATFNGVLVLVVAVKLVNKV